MDLHQDLPTVLSGKQPHECSIWASARRVLMTTRATQGHDHIGRTFHVAKGAVARIKEVIVLGKEMFKKYRKLGL